MSEGCRYCYAEAISRRFGWTEKPWTAHNAEQNVILKPHKLREPYQLKEPSRIFVNSMSDLFHELVPDGYIAKIFEVMAALPQHVFQILTKRPKRAAEWSGPWTPNIWMGTSVEDSRALHRLTRLRSCGASVLFVSFEPLIGPIGSDVVLSGYDWVIVGGESGFNHRPMPHSWARDIRDACLKQEVAFFFKQSAARWNERGAALKHEDGRFYQWRQWPDDLTDPVLAEEHPFTCEDPISARWESQPEIPEGAS